MNKYLFIFCLFLSFCKDNNDDIQKEILKPKACFEFSKTNYNKFDTLIFTNCSINADSFIWDFGDGSIVKDKAPLHFYNSLGDYKIILTALKNTLRDTISIKITISNIPVKAGLLNNSMTHIVFKPEYYVKYSFSDCGYGNALDSFDFFNNYILINARFLDMQAFTICCPPPADYFIE
jgi:PKD repeat protein